MTQPVRASEEIYRAVTSWAGVEAGPGSRGEYGFRVGGRELGHLHGERVAHFSFPARLGLSLKEEGRVVDHPVFPGKPGFASRAINDPADVKEVIDLMRLNYDRIVARAGVSQGEADR